MRSLMFSNVAVTVMLSAGLGHGYALAGSFDSGLTYLNPAAIDISTLLAVPSSPDSDAELKELAAIEAVQAARSPADCVRATTEVTISLDTFFGPAYGPLSADEVAKLTPLFTTLIAESKYFANVGKKLWQRPRPYDEDNALSPCVAKDATPSYPSGHATVARVFAVLLSTVYPERWLAFTTRADQIAFDRVVGGVHHPSDITAGQELGEVIAKDLLQSAKFSAALAAAMSCPAAEGCVGHLL